MKMISDNEVIEASSRDPYVVNLKDSTFWPSNHVDGKVPSLTEHARLNNPGSASHNSDRFEKNNAVACQEVAVLEVSEQLQSETIENGVRAMIDADGSCINTREKDPLKRNFDHLSAKTEVGSVLAYVVNLLSFHA